MKKSWLCILKKPKKPTKQPLDLASEHSKVADFKINMQKSVVFLYSSNEHMETINAIPLTLRKKKKSYEMPKYKSNKICTSIVCRKVLNTNE